MIQFRWYYTLFFSMMASFLSLFDGFVSKIMFFFERAAKRHPGWFTAGCGVGLLQPSRWGL